MFALLTNDSHDPICEETNNFASTFKLHPFALCLQLNMY